MKIAGLQKVTLLDYPKHIAASVFLAGCNFDCGYCHNRWMIRADQVEPYMSVEAFLDWLETRQGLLDGVCVSGGEPTIHAELGDLIDAIRALGFAIKLDTNGALPGRLAPLLSSGRVDYVAMDIKAPLNARYAAVTGINVDLDAIMESMGLLREGHCAFEFRTTMGPPLTLDDLPWIADTIHVDEPWFLNPFVPAKTIPAEVLAMGWVETDELARAAEALRPRLPLVRVRGAD